MSNSQVIVISILLYRFCMANIYQYTFGLSTHPINSHFAEKHLLAFEETDHEQIFIQFSHHQDKTYLNALLEIQEELFRDTLENLKVIDNSLPLQNSIVTVLNAGYNLHVLLQSLHPSLPKFKENNELCTYTVKIFNFEQLGMFQHIEGLYNTSKALIDKNVKKYETFLKTEKYEVVLDNLVWIKTYLNDFHVVISLYIKALRKAIALEILPSTFISLLTAENQECLDLRKNFHTQIQPLKCESTSYGIFCQSEVRTLSKPLYVTQFSGHNFKGCGILSKYYVTEKYGIISLDCNNINCQIVPPNMCVKAIASQNIEEIRTYCNIGYLHNTISKTEYGFVINQISELGYITIRQMFPLLPEESHVPIVISGGKIDLTLDSVKLKGKFLGHTNVFSPRPDFNTSLLCPHIFKPSQQSYFETYAISSINTIMILSLVGLYKFLKRAKNCTDRPTTTVQITESSPPRHLAVTYEPQNSNISPQQRDIYNLLQLATREE